MAKKSYENTTEGTISVGIPGELITLDAGESYETDNAVVQEMLDRNPDLKSGKAKAKDKDKPKK